MVYLWMYTYLIIRTSTRNDKDNCLLLQKKGNNLRRYFNYTFFKKGLFTWKAALQSVRKITHPQEAVMARIELAGSQELSPGFPRMGRGPSPGSTSAAFSFHTHYQKTGLEAEPQGLKPAPICAYMVSAQKVFFFSLRNNQHGNLLSCAIDIWRLTVSCSTVSSGWNIKKLYIFKISTKKHMCSLDTNQHPYFKQ